MPKYLYAQGTVSDTDLDEQLIKVVDKSEREPEPMKAQASFTKRVRTTYKDIPLRQMMIENAKWWYQQLDSKIPYTFVDAEAISRAVVEYIDNIIIPTDSYSFKIPYNEIIPLNPAFKTPSPYDYGRCLITRNGNIVNVNIHIQLNNDNTQLGFFKPIFQLPHGYKPYNPERTANTGALVSANAQINLDDNTVYGAIVYIDDRNDGVDKIILSSTSGIKLNGNTLMCSFSYLTTDTPNWNHQIQEPRAKAIAKEKTIW